MDVKQRIEELTKLSESLNALKLANEEEAKAREAFEQADANARKENGVIVSDIERRNVERLQHIQEAAAKRRDEVAASFRDLREKAVDTLHDEVNAELELYRESGEVGYATQSEAMERVGDPYATNKTEIEMQNIERRKIVYRMDEKLDEHKAKLAEIQAKIDEALAKGDIDSVEQLNHDKADIESIIQRVTLARNKMAVPFKSIDDNEAEYNVLYGLWQSMEDIMDPAREDVLTAESIESTIQALKDLEYIQESVTPAQERYDALRDRQAELQAKKADAKQAIENIKKGLADGTIKGQYVETSKARMAELEAEVAAYEKEEQENAEKMARLEKEEGVKAGEKEKPATEQYDELKDLKKLTEQQIAAKKEDLKKVEEELAAHPDKADELNAKKSVLEGEIATLETYKAKTEQAITDLKAKYKELSDGEQEQGDSKKGDQQGEQGEPKKGEEHGDGSGEGQNKPRTVEAIRAEQEELKKQIDNYRKQIDELRDKLYEDNAQTDESKKLSPEERKALMDQISQLESEKKPLEERRTACTKEIIEIGRQGKEKEKPKAVSLVRDGKEYYKSVNLIGRTKLKIAAYEADHGKAGMFKKMLLFLPSNQYSEKAASMLEAGTISPLPTDVPMLREARRVEEQEAKKASRDPFETLTPEQRKAAEKAAREAAGSGTQEPKHESREEER